MLRSTCATRSSASPHGLAAPCSKSKNVPCRPIATQIQRMTLDRLPCIHTVCGLPRYCHALLSTDSRGCTEIGPSRCVVVEPFTCSLPLMKTDRVGLLAAVDNVTCTREPGTNHFSSQVSRAHLVGGIPIGCVLDAWLFPSWSRYSHQLVTPVEQ